MNKLAVLILVALFVVLTLVIALKKPKEAGLKIVFRSARDAPFDDPDFKANPQKYFELYIMNLDGSNIRRITYNLFLEAQPDVSPDGKKILFSIHLSPGRVKETDPGWEIAVMDIDGNNFRILTNNSWMDFGAHWNHDGTKIVFVSDSAHRTAKDIEDGVLPQYDIYVMNADGSGLKRLTFARPGEINADPSFSFKEPERILYVHSEGLSGDFDMYIMDADGGNKKLVLKHDEMLLAIHDPMFSPDDSKIIFSAKVRESKSGNPIYNIFILDIKGNLLRITEDDGESDVLPQFSPDGNKICYFTYVWGDEGHTHRIRVADADGSNEKILSDYPWESDPTWVPSRN